MARCLLVHGASTGGWFWEPVPGWRVREPPTRHTPLRTMTSELTELLMEAAADL